MGAAAAPGLLDRFLLLRSTYTALKRHRREAWRPQPQPIRNSRAG
jgi:hypothetical protein